MREAPNALKISPTEIPSIYVLGTRVDMVEIPAAAALMAHWIETEKERCHHVVNSGMHGIMEAQRDPKLKSIFASVDLFAPDGILMVLVSRLRGFRIRKHNTGPGFLWEFSEIAANKGYSYYFYGDEDATLRRLSEKLTTAFPGLEIAGFYSPPFRDLTPEEDASITQEINAANPDVLWVGLGMPKQERWIAEHRTELNARVAVGAGASFKLISGDVSRAPAWLRNVGFEWLWRFIMEPRRVWRRVFVDAPQFVGMVALELGGLKTFKPVDRDSDKPGSR